MGKRCRDSHPNIRWSSREHLRRGEGRIVGATGIKDTGTWPIESIKKGSQEVTETEVAITEPNRNCTRSFAYML